MIVGERVGTAWPTFLINGTRKENAGKDVIKVDEENVMKTNSRYSEVVLYFISSANKKLLMSKVYILMVDQRVGFIAFITCRQKIVSISTTKSKHV